MTDQYAVIGNPIAHSKSPLIHAAFATQTGQNLEYQRILGSTENFTTQVQEFFARGGLGLNITLPFKHLAWNIATQSSANANAATAANTLTPCPDGGLIAHNTDGPGLIRDIVHNNHIEIAQRKILLLGAGGAASGILLSLIQQNPKQLIIANRTQAKANALAQRTLTNHPELVNMVSGIGLDQLHDLSFDIIINATSAGINDTIPVIPEHCLKPHGVVYDLLYADQPTQFVKWGQTHGARIALDGLGMLVEQAAEAFYIWRGVRPNTQVVLRSLRG
ncbi:shikimate dehydrogenase [Achromatium sp. WMS2]|nr:shikimate dehydrogenase [Achromatium sp. WMS2]